MELTSASVLAARNVTKRFGGFAALDAVNFDVQEGEVHALLGENGAGKSTLMNVLSGLLRPTSGDVLLSSKQVRFASPSDAARAGVGMVHQHFLLVPPLPVRENLLLGASPQFGGPLSYPVDRVLEEARAVADRLGWVIPWNAPAGSLPVGTQQRVEILKALRGETRVLIFDEPTAVLTPTETPELFQTIRRLADEGRGVVFISHKLDEVLSLAKRVTVLRRGRVVHQTTTRETDAGRLARAMVGDDSDAARMLAGRPPSNGTVPRPMNGESKTPPLPSPSERGGSTLLLSAPSPTGDERPPLPKGEGGGGVSDSTSGDVQPASEPFIPFFTVQNLTVIAPPKAPRPLLANISFAVAPGEIFGVAGVDGNGQTELSECLAGLLRPDTGQIVVAGATPETNPGAFRRAGVAVIPADRHTRGLALPLSVTENLALGVYDKREFSYGPVLSWPRLTRRAAELIARFDIRTSGPQAPARSLSGGNQQKIVIARALSDNPRVVIAVNPTRGLDVGAIAYVHDALRQAQKAGAAIVLISTELDEVLNLSDRVAVLYEGRFSGIIRPDTSREQIGLLMGGKA